MNQGHVQRRAVVYVRQSTPQQVREHGESLARQYGLRQRAEQLGWHPTLIEVVDEDLGLSARSAEKRTGFQRLLADVAQNHVGLVLALETSRLARSSKDWHDLFELCAVRDVLLADEDGTYNALDPNDRLVLGMKGILSEMELHIMKGRLERGRLNKAKRGELFHGVPRGYVRLSDNRVELDPDEQARGALRLVFAKYDELGTAYGVLRYLREHDIKLPRRSRGALLWQDATETIISTMLHHPMYAGAYTYGRRENTRQADVAGRSSSRRRSRPMDEWKVLLWDHLPAYITKEQFIANQERLWQNSTRANAKGAPRQGPALATGLLFCGCGRRMYVGYTGKRVRYECSRRPYLATDTVCRGIRTAVVDEALAQSVLKALEPASLELSLQTIEQARTERRRLDEQLRQRVARATYEAQRADRQFQAVEPENRLVGRTLEERWEAALRRQREAEEQYDCFRGESPTDVSAEERARLEEVARDLPALWWADGTTWVDRKQIVRCLVDRIDIHMAEAGPHVHLSIQWKGGCVTEHEVTRASATYAELPNMDRLAARVVELRRAGWRAPRIAEQLNAEGFVPPKQSQPFTGDVVRKLLSTIEPICSLLESYELKPNEWTIADLAKRLALPQKKLKGWVTRGWARAVQRPMGAVWILWADDEEFSRLKQLAQLSRPGMTNYPAALTTPKVLPAE
ncbi:MAG TPA: recombinase family protein [Pirellulales bacterium]|nr:recombinase family protein [Pirellulales bacterium]